MDVNDFAERIKERLAQLVPPLQSADPIVVAVSGGPDSLALLHVLTKGGLHAAQKVIAAHLDHQWRESSAEEAESVARLASSWGAQTQVDRINTRELARAQGRTLEEAGRVARYRFLGRVAQQAGATLILTAHHADDQVETVLMHFLRGSGLDGLRGMVPVATVPGWQESALQLVRPMLEIRRETILAYCQQHDLQPIEDPSNQDLSFFRNRLRHQLLPVLENYNPQIRRTLLHTAEVLRADEELLTELRNYAWRDVLVERGDGWLRLDRAGWAALPLSLRRSTLRFALQQLRPELRDVGFTMVEQVRQLGESPSAGVQASLPGDLQLHVGYEELLLTGVPARNTYDLPQLPGRRSLLLPLPGSASLANDWHIEATRVMKPELLALERNASPWRAYVDAGASLEWEVRSRRPGERFQPLGMAGHTAKVKDVMINRKIPAVLRERWPIVANSKHVIWLVGHQIDERVRVTGDSQHVFQLTCRKRTDD